MRFIISGYLSLFIQFGPLIGVPVLAYYFDNWWMLFGIAFVYAGIGIGYTKIKYILFISLSIVFFSYWYLNGSSFNQLISFYFSCFLFGFIGITLYILIGFGDKNSRTMIAALGNKHARAEIDEEIEAGMNKWRSEKENTDI